MAKIRIYGNEYELDQLDEQARATVASIRFVDERIAEKRNQLAIADTARIAYTRALRKELKSNEQQYASQDRRASRAKITIDDTEYETEDSSLNGKAHLASLHYLQRHKVQLENEIALLEVAKQVYVRKLKYLAERSVNAC